MAYTTINDPTDYFRIQTWSGNNSADREITWTESDNMQPDWIWVKRRSDTANHRLADSVRGATKILRSDTNDAESTEIDDTLSFDTNGFSVGNNSGVNKTGDTYVGWGWLGANGTASNTDGSITSTVSANTTSGFSIVSYTGNGTYPSTIGHGLGSVPQVLLTKKRNGTLSWQVYHIGTGNTKKLQLNGSNAESSDTVWNNTTPTSSVFTVGNSDTNNSGDTFIAYCFAEKKGFSKFGSYTGNGSTDGTFVYTGFKPAWVMVKNTGAAENWIIFDNRRPGYNLTDALLKPSLSNAESTTGVKFDMLSNGFKARVSDAEGNSSGGNFIYLAFAESPFTTSTGVPTTAR